MNSLLAWFNSPEWMIVVKTLLHTLWQAGGLALLLWIALRHVATPSSRYRLTLGTLTAILGTTLLTWGVLNQSTPATAAPDFALETMPAHKPSTTSRTANFGEPSVIAYSTPIPKPAEETRWSGWLALAWMLGAALMLTRAGIQVAGAERLRRSCKPLDDSHITQLLAEAQRALNLTRRIRVAVTHKLTSPAVVGVIVPTLILPLTLLTTLTPEQIRFILLHELAHIRRGDYFANLFQLFIEALLFFNPAVWWISHQVRREREACCDALAIELSGAPVDYARTLLHVAETVLNPPPTAATAFSDNPREPSSLTDRVQRLLVPGYRPALRLTWRAMLAAIVVGGTLLFLSAIGARSTVGAVLSPKHSALENDRKTTIANAADEILILTNGLELKLLGQKLTADFIEVNKTTGKVVARGNVRLETTNGISHGDEFRSNNATNLEPGIIIEWEKAISPVQWTNPLPTGWMIDDSTGRLGNKWFYYRVKPSTVETNSTARRGRLIAYEGFDYPDGSKTEPRLFNKPAADLISLSKSDNQAKPLLNAGTLKTGNDDQWFYYRVGSGLAQPATNLTSEQQILANAEAVSQKISELGKSNSGYKEIPRRWVHYRVDTNMPVTAVNGRSAILEKLSQIRLENFACDKQPLKEVLLRLSSESRLNDPDKRGIYFAEIVDATPEKEFTEIDAIPITIRPGQGKSSLWDVLTLLVKGAETPIEFYISDDAVMFMLESQHVLRSSSRPVPVYAKTFQADPTLLARAFGLLPESTGSVAMPPDVVASSTNASPKASVIRKTLMRIGVDLNPAQGKLCFYKPESGVFYVKATLDDLDAIEEFIKANCTPPPQVNIKIRWVEIPQKLMTPAWLNAASNTFFLPLADPNTRYNILTEQEMADVRHRIERRDGINLLSEGQVTTLTERQAQITVSEAKTVVTGIKPAALSKPGVISTNNDASTYLQTDATPLGPVFDVLPTVSADEDTISLQITVTLTEFLGYDKAKKDIPIYVNGKKTKTTLPLPKYLVRQMTNTTVVPDGRTLILGNFPVTETAKQPNGEFKTTDVTSTQTNLLFILVTPTIIDPAGNRAKPAPRLNR